MEIQLKGFNKMNKIFKVSFLSALLVLMSCEIPADLNDNPNEITYTVTVSSSKYKLDGVETPSISMQPGFTYIFDQSDSTNVVSGGTENHHRRSTGLRQGQAK